MPFTDVSMVGDTLTKPRSIATPSASRPTPFVRAARPTAIRTCWASNRPPSVSITTPVVSGFTELTLTPVLIVMPRRERLRVSCALTSSSSIGTIRGSASSSVTSTPYER